MIIDVRQLHGIYLVCGKTDLRRGIDGLANVVSEQYVSTQYQIFDVESYCELK